MPLYTGVSIKSKVKNKNGIKIPIVAWQITVFGLQSIIKRNSSKHSLSLWWKRDILTYLNIVCPYGERETF